MRQGIAQTVFEHEQLSLQFIGDLTVLDRVGFLSQQLAQTDTVASASTALIQAQVHSMMHRFAEANSFSNKRKSLVRRRRISTNSG